MHRHHPFTALLLVVLVGSMLPGALARAQGPASRPDYLFYGESFDAGSGGYTASGNTSWAWGAPAIGAHSPPNAWATNPGGNYNNGENGYATSPDIDLSYSGGSCTLGWWQWRETETSYDYISTEVSSDGGSTWNLIYGPYSGSDPNWRQVTAGLTEGYNTSHFRVRFHFTSDGSVTYRGWYVDDVTVDCPLQAPIFSNSTKAAPADAVVGDPIAYTVRIVNSGTLAAQAASLDDPIPPGTTYLPGSVACTAGACSYDGGSGRVLWNGTVDVGASVTVTFQVDTDDLPCGAEVVNSATIDDPQALQPVTRQATTRMLGLQPLLSASFDDAAFPPSGWSVYSRDGDGTAWVRRTTLPHSGAGTAVHFYSPAILQDGWLVTPRFTVSPDLWLSFWQRDDYPSGDWYGRHSILVTTGSSPDPGVSTYVEIWSGDAQPTWEQAWVDLRAYAGQEVFVAFRYEGVDTRARILGGGEDPDGDNWYVDDVLLVEPWYPCPVATLASSQAITACRATDVHYALFAEYNYLTDTFDLTPLGNAWPTTVQPPTVTFPILGSAPVTVTVRVPWDALPGTTDTAVVRLAGRTYGFSDSATLATTAIRGTWAPAWQGSALDVEPPYFSASYYEAGHVCVVGGWNYWAWAVTNRHDCYDIGTATWFSRPAVPTGVAFPAYGLIDGRFYVAGGFVGDMQSTTSLVQVYDLAAGAWYTATSLPTARGGQASGVVDGRLYSAGGGTSAYYTLPTDCPTYEYDPLTNSWAERASCPLQYGYGLFEGGSVGSSFHGRLFAGGHRGLLSETVYGWYAYDPAADSWQTLANLPLYGNYGPLIAEDPETGILYQIGGRDSWEQAQAAVNSYDYLSDTWSEAPPDLAQPAGCAAGPAYGSFGDPAVGGFWAVGGWGLNGPLYALQRWGFAPCPALVPDLAVAPGAVDAGQCPESVVSHTLAVCNEGYAPMDWSMEEVTRTLRSASVDIPWLSAGPLSGTLGVRECQPVTVRLDSGGLAPGEYRAGLAVGSSDPDTPTLTVPVTLTVGSFPDAVVSAPPLQAALCPSATAGLEMGLCNAGDCPLEWTAVELTPTRALAGVPWLTVEPAQGTLPGTACVTIAVSFDAAGAATGTHAARLLLASNDPDTPTSTLPVTMTVYALPAASFTHAPLAGYVPLTVTFTSTSSAAISPTWSFGDGCAAAGVTVSHAYTAAGDYTATLWVQSPFGCGGGEAAAVVHVAEPGAPLAGFVSSAPDCLGGTTTFTNTTVASGTVTYRWAFGDGGMSDEENPAHLYSAAGTYTVVLTATNVVQQWDTARGTVVVEAGPVAGFTFTVAGPAVTFTNSTTGAVAYLWAFGDGITSTETHPVHVYALAGPYTVVLTATGTCGVGAFAAEVAPGSPGYAIYLPLITRGGQP